MLRLWVGLSLLMVLLLPLFDMKKGFSLWIIVAILFGLLVLFRKKSEKDYTDSQ